MMQLETTINDRIAQLIDYKCNKNQKKFAEIIKFAPQVISNIVSGRKTKPSFDVLNAIKSSFEDISADWLLTGEGDMLKSASGISQQIELYKGSVPAVVTVDSQQQDNIVLVPQAVQAGYLAGGFAEPNFIRKLPSYRMPGIANGVFRMFEVRGNSMFPTIPARSFVVGQFVEDWTTGIKDNQIYVIISADIADGLVKRCINRIEKYNNLVCKSDNRREFPNQNIDPASIREIWEVKLHLNTNLPDPADIYERVSDLEARIEEINRKLA